MSLPKGNSARTQPPIALMERDHVHDEVAEELGIDPDRLLAEIADTIRQPFMFWADA